MAKKKWNSKNKYIAVSNKNIAKFPTDFKSISLKE